MGISNTLMIKSSQDIHVNMLVVQYLNITISEKQVGQVQPIYIRKYEWLKTYFHKKHQILKVSKFMVKFMFSASVGHILKI